VASIGNDPGGRRRILFTAPDKRRKTIRLGRCSQRQAETVRGHVEHLAAATLTGAAPPDETSRWVAALPDLLHGRLAAVGLTTARVPEAPAPAGPTLGPFLDGYLAARVDLKPSTLTALRQAARYLTEHFGTVKPLRDILPGDADGWRLFLVGKGLADATVRRRCGQAKQFFKSAVRKHLLPANPFADLQSANAANPARQHYLPRDVAKKVLDACPDAEWRLIFALCRYGGLRCPSEIVRLRWGDVLWSENRFIVTSPKTARHPGGASRQVPLFPELLPYLREAFEQAAPGTEYVITRYRKTNGNLSTQLRRILWKAGIDPWPRLFQNLRASADTDLAQRFPAHVCARWLGHSPAIAAKHYLQVTDADFEAAANGSLTKAAHSPDSAAQNPAQYLHVPGFPERKGEAADVQETRDLPADTEPVTSGHIDMVGDTGLEPVTSCVSSRRSSHLS